MDTDPGIIDPSRLVRRRTWWQEHGSWAILGMVAFTCLAIGIQIGNMMTQSQIYTLIAEQSQETKELRESYEATNRDLTGKLAQAVKQATGAADTAAGAVQSVLESQSGGGSTNP